MGTISVLVVSLIAPTLNGCLSLSLCSLFSHSRLSKRWLSLKTVSEKGRFVSLLPLFLLKLPLIIPNLPKDGPFSLLFIQAFHLSYCFFHGLRIIILNIVTHGRWKSTQISLNLDSLMFDDVTPCFPHLVNINGLAKNYGELINVNM
jgi:hypothetical protein